MDVQSVVQLFQKKFPNIKVGYSTENTKAIEMSYLGINSNKSARELKWKPKYSIQEAVEEISFWYEGLYAGIDPVQLTRKSIKNFLLIV
jgi:UDP-glucose 4-epimerase